MSGGTEPLSNEVSEKEEIDRIIKRQKEGVKSLKPDLDKLEGKIGVWKAEGKDTNTEELTVITFSEMLKSDEEASRFLTALSSWISRLEQETKDSRSQFLKLLGLDPDASSEEVRDAVDDLGAVFAGYRKKKRGT